MTVEKIEGLREPKEQMRLVIGLCIYGAMQHYTILTMMETLQEFITWAQREGHPQCQFAAAFDTLICGARESCVLEAEKAEATHLLFLDADMVFQPFAIRRLAENALQNDLDIVSGFYCTRHPPYRPLMFVRNPNDPHGRKYGQFQPAEYGSTFSVDGTGFGCCLINMDVFKNVEKPWFVLDSQNENGNASTEDVYFMRKVRAAGMKIHVDTGVVCGHIGPGGMVIPSVDSPYARINHPTIDAQAWREKNGVKMVAHEDWVRARKHVGEAEKEAVNVQA